MTALSNWRAARLLLLLALLVMPVCAFANTAVSDVVDDSMNLTCREILENASRVVPINRSIQARERFSALLDWVIDNYTLRAEGERKNLSEEKSTVIWADLRMGINGATTTLKLVKGSIVYSQTASDGHSLVVELHDVSNSSTKTMNVTQVAPNHDYAEAPFLTTRESYSLVLKSSVGDLIPIQNLPPSAFMIQSPPITFSYPKTEVSQLPTQPIFNVSANEVKKLIHTLSDLSKYDLNIEARNNKRPTSALRIKIEATEHTGYVEIRDSHDLENYYISDEPNMTTKDNKLEVRNTADPNVKILVFTETYRSETYQIRLGPKTKWQRFLAFLAR